MKKIIFLFSLLIFLFIPLKGAWGSSFTLVIDAGHGGKDAGAIGAISQEKNINLSVALAFGRYIEQNCPQVRVIYTRKTDVFIELQERANIANRNKADLFISVHTNALAGNKIAHGFETYTLGMHRAADNLAVAKRENSVITMESDYQSKYQGFDPNSSESYIMFEYMQDKNMENSVNLAKFIQTNVCQSASRQNKGVHQAGFLVLRQTSMPSCLVELGFISTPDEEQQLNDPIVQDQYARGLYQAFVQYVNKYGHGVQTKELPRAQVTETRTEKPQPAPEKEIQKPSETQKPETQKPSETQKPETQKPETQKPSALGSAASVAPAEKETQNPKPKTQYSDPVFKVQIMSTSTKLKTTDSRFQGLADIEIYKEDNLYKYTYGASTNYNEIAALRKSILDKFPQAFVIAFRGDEKMNVIEAMKEWRRNRTKR